MVFDIHPDAFDRWIAVGDLTIKVIGAIALVWGALVSFPQYRRQKLFEKELELYGRASEAASKIANAAKDHRRDSSAESEFWVLYWGPLCIVEAPNVEAAMVAFGRALQKDTPAVVLASLSYALAHAAREAVQERFSVDLGKLSGERVECSR